VRKILDSMGYLSDIYYTSNAERGTMVALTSQPTTGVLRAGTFTFDDILIHFKKVHNAIILEWNNHVMCAASQKEDNVINQNVYVACIFRGDTKYTVLESLLSGQDADPRIPKPLQVVDFEFFNHYKYICKFIDRVCGPDKPVKPTYSNYTCPRCKGPSYLGFHEIDCPVCGKL
jgi:hypothetical protein